VYSNQGNYAKAMDYYFKALKINDELGDKRGQAANLTNLGNLFSNQGNYAKALEYYFKALKIDEEIGKKGVKLST
jgi:tetratricopeptide (TPR) repeat protein